VANPRPQKKFVRPKLVLKCKNFWYFGCLSFDQVVAQKFKFFLNFFFQLRVTDQFGLAALDSRNIQSIVEIFWNV
jgi:hypothetical protein